MSEAEPVDKMIAEVEPPATTIELCRMRRLVVLRDWMPSLWDPEVIIRSWM